MNITHLDSIKERLERAIDAVEDAQREILAGRTMMAPDTYSVAGDPGVEPSATLSEATEFCDEFAPVSVRAWAVVRDFWIVRVPIRGEDGEREGEEIVEFATKAEAERYCASAEAADDTDG